MTLVLNTTLDKGHNFGEIFIFTTYILQQLYYQVTKRVKFLSVTFTLKSHTYFLAIPTFKHLNIKEVDVFFISYVGFPLYECQKIQPKEICLLMQGGQIFYLDQYYRKRFSFHNSSQWKTFNIHKEKDVLEKLLKHRNLIWV